MKNSKLNEILLLRPLLILCVIMGHCFAIYNGSWKNTYGVEEIEFYKYFNPIFRACLNFKV